LREQGPVQANRCPAQGQGPGLASRYLVREQVPEFRQRERAQARERYRWMPVR
jgi:hypothetical protein